MLFKELLNIVNYDDVWYVLDREYEHKQGGYEAYKRVMEELKSLEAKPCEKQTTLVVAKVEDSFTPGEFTFEVFGIYEGDEERYSLVMALWEEWNGLTVLDKSIEMYGAAAVIAPALYEMTFYGYSTKAQAKRVAEEIQILNERLDEIESGKAQLIPHEEVISKLGIVDNRTPEEKEQQRKEFERIHAKNIEVYKTLLGSS